MILTLPSRRLLGFAALAVATLCALIPLANRSAPAGAAYIDPCDHGLVEAADTVSLAGAIAGQGGSHVESTEPIRDSRAVTSASRTTFTDSSRSTTSNDRTTIAVTPVAEDTDDDPCADVATSEVNWAATQTGIALLDGANAPTWSADPDWTWVDDAMLWKDLTTDESVVGDNSSWEYLDLYFGCVPPFEDETAPASGLNGIEASSDWSNDPSGSWFCDQPGAGLPAGWSSDSFYVAAAYHMWRWGTPVYVMGGVSADYDAFVIR